MKGQQFQFGFYRIEDCTSLVIQQGTLVWK